MSRRLFFLPLVLVLLCLAALPACKKKAPDTGGQGDPPPSPGPTPPPAVSSELFLFAHLNTKQIRDSAVFKEVKDAFAKSGGSELDALEGEFAKEIGVKPTEIDSVTVCVPEFPTDDDDAKFIVIVSANKAFNKARVFGFQLPTKPDSRGLYPAGKKYVFVPKGQKAPE
ncbi:MAG: hypothetical protein L0241_18240, partial [Planctomycetia bacterium]|nr:hypothetical protein [Planctomycetia bacterium]